MNFSHPNVISYEFLQLVMILLKFWAPISRLYSCNVYTGIWQPLIGCIYSHIVYAEIWYFVCLLLIQPYCIRGNLATTYKLHIQPHCIHGNLMICWWAAYITILYTREFGDLFVCHLYNHIVYTGIWWFISRPLIQPYCIRGNLVIWLYAAYTITVYMRVFGVQFVSPRIQLHWISGHMFQILKVVMFFIPKAHMFFDMVESDL